MGRASGRAVTEHADTPTRAESAARLRAGARQFVSDVVPVGSVAPRTPTGSTGEVGGSTLKQNAALLERLREVAMRGDRGPIDLFAPEVIEEPVSLREPPALPLPVPSAPPPLAALANDEPTTSFPVARRARRRRRWRVLGFVAVAVSLGLLAASAGTHAVDEGSTTAAPSTR
jgi:hypothetical protein